MESASALSSVFERVQRPTTFEETVERLGTAIRLGLLPPGAQLPPERELAEQLGIARSTLRQALTTLVQSGHLVAQRGRGGGTFVAERPPLRGGTGELPENWRQALDLRVAIECGAAVLAAERRDPVCLKRMETSIADMDAAHDFESYRRADVRFHIALAEATGTPRIIAAMTEIQGVMTDLITPLAHPTEVMVHSNEDHRQLVAALHEGDAASAVMILRAHLRGAEHIIAGLAPS